jgi:hypothetical protein
MSMSQNKSDVVPPQRPSTQPNRLHIRRHRSVLFTDAEWAHVQETARLCGTTRSEFLRETALGRRVRAKPFLANADLVRELAKSGMALTHLATTARESGALPLADKLETALAELRALIRRIASPEARSGAR